jgi:hypothetical protein
MRNHKRHYASTLITTISLFAALSACGGSEEQKISVATRLPSLTSVLIGGPDPGSATRAVEQLKASGVSVANQRCGYFDGPELVIHVGGTTPTSLVVEIPASQLPNAIAAGFFEVSASSMQYFNNSFDCASRSL